MRKIKGSSDQEQPKRKFLTGILVMIIAGTGCQAGDVIVDIDRAVPATSVEIPETETAAPTLPPRPTITPTPPSIPGLTATEITEIAGTPLPVGFQPVNHNADWKPLIREFDGVEMALVPAGCFDMGSTDEQLDYAMQKCEELRGPGNCHRRIGHGGGFPGICSIFSIYPDLNLTVIILSNQDFSCAEVNDFIIDTLIIGDE